MIKHKSNIFLQYCDTVFSYIWHLSVSVSVYRAVRGLSRIHTAHSTVRCFHADDPDTAVRGGGVGERVRVTRRTHVPQHDRRQSRIMNNIRSWGKYSSHGGAIAPTYTRKHLATHLPLVQAAVDLDILRRPCEAWHTAEHTSVHMELCRYPAASLAFACFFWAQSRWRYPTHRIKMSGALHREYRHGRQRKHQIHWLY